MFYGLVTDTPLSLPAQPSRTRIRRSFREPGLLIDSARNLALEHRRAWRVGTSRSDDGYNVW